MGTLTHTEHHGALVETVFKSNDGEAIADLLCAFTITDSFLLPTYALLDICTRYIADLPNRATVLLSPRLRQCVIRYLGCMGFRIFQEVDAGEFVGLLNRLHVGVEDVGGELTWGPILLGVMGSPDGVQHLAIQYWELLVELKLSFLWPPDLIILSPHVMDFLLASEQWDKLECWVGVCWMSPGYLEQNLHPVTLSLFCQQPSAIAKLREWIQRRNIRVPEAFRQISKQAREAQLSVPLSLPSHSGIDFVLGQPHHLPKMKNLLTCHCPRSPCHWEVTSS